ncbi:MAG TPA: transposase [Burkholderiaceae bacterium]|nr:transposase [Burkholderiaceae bacterium]
MNTIQPQPSGERRRRRFHSDEFKANAVAAAAQPGVSLASVAMSLGINANLLRRWIRDAEVPTGHLAQRDATEALRSGRQEVMQSSFVPVQLDAAAAPVAAVNDIRLEVRRGSTTVVATWPAGLAAECATWLRELLR